jgi:hypothetical protein
MRLLFYAILACCLLAVSCSMDWLVDYEQPLSIEEYQARYSNYDDLWVGHQVDELIAKRGQPDDVLEAKPWGCSFQHGVPVLSYIYYSETTSSRSCIDTFVVVAESGAIIKYYCR